MAVNGCPLLSKNQWNKVGHLDTMFFHSMTLKNIWIRCVSNVSCIKLCSTFRVAVKADRFVFSSHREDEMNVRFDRSPGSNPQEERFFQNQCIRFSTCSAEA